MNEAHQPELGSKQRASQDSLMATSRKQRIPENLLYPHYTDRRFTGATSDGLTVFLASGRQITQRHGIPAVDGAYYDHSDRLIGAFGNRYEAACKKAEEAVGDNNTAGYFEQILRELHGKPDLEIVHILAGVGGDGYSYRIFGYIIPSKMPHPEPQ